LKEKLERKTYLEPIAKESIEQFIHGNQLAAYNKFPQAQPHILSMFPLIEMSSLTIGFVLLWNLITNKKIGIVNDKKEAR
jgi:hypothetical protein